MSINKRAALLRANIHVTSVQQSMQKSAATPSLWAALRKALEMSATRAGQAPLTRAGIGGLSKGDKAMAAGLVPATAASGYGIGALSPPGVVARHVAGRGDVGSDKPTAHEIGQFRKAQGKPAPERPYDPDEFSVDPLGEGEKEEATPFPLDPLKDVPTESEKRRAMIGGAGGATLGALAGAGGSRLYGAATGNQSKLRDILAGVTGAGVGGYAGSKV